MDQVLDSLRAAADPTRLRILALLEAGELTVSELVTILGQSQPRISRHLKILVDAGLLSRFREGSWVFHRLSGEDSGASRARLIVSLIPRDDALRGQDALRLKEIELTRSQAAEAYFAKDAPEWDRLRQWPDGGPEVLWSTEVGQGYSAAAIFDGKVYFNDYDEATFEFLVRCLTLDEGKELWRFKEKRRVRPNHGITRSVPATDGKFVFSLDPKAVLHALDAETGKEIWRKNFVQDYGSKIPPWYNGQNPLIEDDKVLVAPVGTSALVVALDKATGKEIWTTPNPEGWLLSHASLTPAKGP